MPNTESQSSNMDTTLESSSKYCMEIRTMQANAFKVLIEALKELLTDTAIQVSPSGFKIVTMDNSRVVLVHLKLDASGFEHFYCDGTIVLGVNMLNLYKIIKTVNSYDTLTLFVTRDNVNQLGIRIDKQEKDTFSCYKLNLLDLKYENLSIPPADFASVITLPSNDFQKICRDMHNIAENIDITKVNNKLILSCKGDFCTQETVITDHNVAEEGGGGGEASVDGETNSTIKTETRVSSKVTTATVTNHTDEIIQGVFSLKYLCLFTKCTNLSNTVEIYMKNDYPLIVKYTVARLGRVKLCVCPLTNDE